MTEVIHDQTPPILQGPTDKEKKYDRQLRLWAATGQQALEDAHILLLNSGAGAVGVETLKNLVLPGIGKFTIADDALVTEADLGVNFFLDEECLGKSRAESCVKLLQELNPDVQSDWFPKQENESVESLLKHQFTLIIYALPIDPQTLASVRAYGEQHDVPLISIHSAGFYSYFRTELSGTFPIVDTHPDSTATTDLRLLEPWPELSKFAIELTSDMKNLTAHKHGHVPYVALLLHYLAQWKEGHGSFPNTYKDKTAFRAQVGGEAWVNDENYEEAVAAVLKTISTPNLASSVREVFEYEPSEVESKSSFWIIAAAIKSFHAKHNALPLPGSVPDMKAESDVYVQLQNLYKSKARQDVAEVLEIVRASPGGEEIEIAEVETFCKNAAFIKLIHGCTASMPNIKDVFSKESENDEMASMTMMPLSLLPIYLALKATSHVPSATPSDILATIDKEVEAASSNPRVVQAAEEVARAQGGELHNVSALTGGMVAQEIIKIITKQYIPIDNTCIFDGINSRTQVLRI